MSEQRKMTREDYWGMYSFECSCGGRMSINGQRLSEAIVGAKSFRCPNHFYNKCNKSYAAAHFKKIALHIPPTTFIT